MTSVIAGGTPAPRIALPASPTLRVRYQRGVLVDPLGFPYWPPSAYAVVELPPAPPELTVDEVRVLDVLTANGVLAGDQLWAGDTSGRTPAGWTWAHQARTRQVSLVPVELHGSYRHLGGVSTAGLPRDRRGVPADRSPVRFGYAETLTEAALAEIEKRLGLELPVGYRTFLGTTNGGHPLTPAIHPGYGFVVDQPLFGVARKDRLQDLVYAGGWLRDRFTEQYLPIGYVQGGMLAVQVSGAGAGSVWYWDDDDPRDEDAFGPAEVCDRLLYRCSATFAAFLGELTEVPDRLRRLAGTAVGQGAARRLAPADLGTNLPANRRPGRAKPG